MMLSGYSQDIFHFLPHPFSTKNFNGRLVNDDNLYRVQRHQSGTELQPKEQFICFQRKSLCERKVIAKDQLESDLGCCWKIETQDNSKMRVRLRQWRAGDNGFDVARTWERRGPPVGQILTGDIHLDLTPR